VIQTSSSSVDEWEVLTNTPATSSLLDIPPKIAFSAAANAYVVLATLNEAGAGEIFRAGKSVTERQLHSDCFAGMNITPSNVVWYFQQSEVFATAYAQALSAARRPQVLWSNQEECACSYVLHVANNNSWFEGHFPDQPVLPGVVQIDWALGFSECLGVNTGMFAAIPRVKFSALILPDMVLRLTLTRKSARLQFVYESMNGVHSKGSIEIG
jgi:3-hydroxymyristoyl/3-hydroxydecanoyl-(acyl carrier protein) dehydratase